jgi:3-hydroxybutyryl-CoA dehydrogenase
MGAAASVCFQRAGFDVLLWARDEAKLSGIGPVLGRLHEWLDEQGGDSPAANRGTVTTTADRAALDDRADVIVDCIIENLDAKAALLRQFPSARSREAIFLTMTSGLPITQIGRAADLEHLLVGAHFWNPPHLMPLVEVIRGERTPEHLFELTCELIERVGKIAVRVNRDVPGFIGNRLQHAMWREAIRLVQDGVATAADVDRVVRLTFALRLPAVGPLENADLVGLDLVKSIEDYLLADLADDRTTPDRVNELIASGRLGVKSGEGFYDWKTRSAGELVERRDRQIVHQLRTLREMGAM